MTDPVLESLHEWMRITMRNAMHNLVRLAREQNSSVAQVNALFRLRHMGTCGVSDLGEELGVSHPAASQLLEKLVQQGLVMRTEDPQDRRNKRIALSPAGERVVQESIQARQVWLADVNSLLTAEERQQVNASLQLLIQKARQMEAAAQEKK
jgi:DNA-binding MarR family transcriptional regulator